MSKAPKSNYTIAVKERHSNIVVMFKTLENVTLATAKRHYRNQINFYRQYRERISLVSLSEGLPFDKSKTRQIDVTIFC